MGDSRNVQGLIFGAGASKKARYPLASELISTVEKFVLGSPTLTKDWERWSSWRNNACGIVKELLSNPNPEVVLSLPDLYEAALQAAAPANLGKVLADTKAGDLEQFKQLKKYYDGKYKELDEAHGALSGFRECLRWYFFYLHYRDSKNREKRDYLRRHLARLSEGDMVITLNYDTTAERTLAEEGSWNPIAGYGFRKELKKMPWQDPLPKEFPEESKVTVLKLHGSIGWHPIENSSGQNSSGLYFDGPRFLRNFDFYANNQRLHLVDPEAPNAGPAEGSVLLYPSFLKQLSNSVMQQIWYAAGEALRKAQHVEIYGYSLPASDIAVRTLLNLLRFRCERDLILRIHDPSPEAQCRWREFIGDKEIDGRLIEEPPVDADRKDSAQ